MPSSNRIVSAAVAWALSLSLLVCAGAIGSGCKAQNKIATLCSSQSQCGDGSCIDNKCFALSACDSCPSQVCANGTCLELACSTAHPCPHGNCVDGHCVLTSTEVEVLIQEIKGSEQPFYTAPRGVEVPNTDVISPPTCSTDADCAAKSTLKPGTCQRAACVSGSCMPVNQPVGTSCDDGKFCTVGDSCGADGQCSGSIRDCSGDADQCHSASCDESSQACVKTVLTGNSCDDGKFCTVGDTCGADGQCNGKARDCSGSADQCHSASCDESSQACVKTVLSGKSCDDNLYCTVNDSCGDDGACHGQPRDCGSLTDQCNDGVCSEANSRCEALPKVGQSCNDGLFCTVSDQCSPQGQCVGQPRDCSGLNDTCNVGSCDEAQSSCVAITRSNPPQVCIAPDPTCELVNICPPDPEFTGPGCEITVCSCDQGFSYDSQQCRPALATTQSVSWPKGSGNGIGFLVGGLRTIGSATYAQVVWSTTLDLSSLGGPVTDAGHSNGSYSLIRLSADGQWQWTFTYPNVQPKPSGVGHDAQGRLILPVFAGPGAMLTTPSGPVAVSGTLLVVLDPATGAVISYTPFGANLTIEQIASHADGVTYVSGSFITSVTWGSSTLSSQTRRIFVGRINADGTLDRATAFVRGGDHSTARLTLGADGHVVISGIWYIGNVQIGTLNAPNQGGSDIYLAKLDGGSLAPLWARTVGGPENEDVADLVVTSDGAVVLTGRYNNTVNFNTDGGSDPHTSAAAQFGQNLFVTRLAGNGSYGWTVTLPHAAGSTGVGLAATSDGGVVVIANLSGSIGNSGCTTLAGQSVCYYLYNSNSALFRLTAQGGLSWFHQLPGRDGLAVVNSSVSGQMQYLLQSPTATSYTYQLVSFPVTQP